MLRHHHLSIRGALSCFVALLACTSAASAPAKQSPSFTTPPNVTTIHNVTIPNGIPTEDLSVWAHRFLISSQRSESVGIWLGVCSDLCRAGLGGTSCGPTCVAATPDTLMMGMRVSGVSSKPRQEVCPILCSNNLGYPLCGCTIHTVRAGTPDWTGICLEFCRTQGMALTGCGSCEDLEAKVNGTIRNEASIQINLMSMKPIPYKASSGKSVILNDKTIHFNDADIGIKNPDDWEEWCNLVCRTGDGGAACNCDLAPLY